LADLPRSLQMDNLRGISWLERQEKLHISADQFTPIPTKSVH